MNGRTIADDMEREYQRAALRDTFAAAALTGLIASEGSDATLMGVWCYRAYAWADAMLRERSRAGQKMAESDSSRAGCPERDRSNHDAAPAARAEDEMKEPNGSSTGEPGGEPESTVRTGKQPAPPCVEADGFSSGSRTGQINRTPERQSPDRECVESSLRDVPQQDNCRAAGGPEHHISKAEIDALEFVVEEGRIANIHDYGILRSLLIRLRQEWEFRPEPYGKSDEKRGNPPTKRETTQPRNGALGEPVAWAVVHACGFGGVVDCYTSTQWCQYHFPGQNFRYVPLYRHPQPTLTADEREAIEWCRDNITAMACPSSAFACVHTATLRKLLERLGGSNG